MAGTPASMASKSIFSSNSFSSKAKATMQISQEEIENVQKYIENALDLKLKGNATNYNFLIQQLQVSQIR